MKSPFQVPLPSFSLVGPDGDGFWPKLPTLLKQGNYIFHEMGRQVPFRLETLRTDHI